MMDREKLFRTKDFKLLLQLFLFLWCCINQTLAKTCLGTGYENPLDPRYCFLYFSGPNATTYDSAVTKCESIGGHLLAPNSANDTQLTQSTFTQLRVDSSWLRIQRENRRMVLWKWISKCQTCGNSRTGGSPTIYQGCYKDVIKCVIKDCVNPPDDLAFTVTTLTSVTPETCVNECSQKNYTFAGIKNEVVCGCGDAFGRYGLTGAGNTCTLPCPDGTQRCGTWGGNAMFDVDGSYSNWAYGQPNNFNNYQLCAAMDPNNRLKYADEDCKRALRYICQTARPCETNTTTRELQLNNSCASVSLQQTTWFDARIDCLNNGGDLIMIDSLAEFNAIKSFIESINFGSRVSFWIGLVSNVWYIPEGDDLSHYAWAPGYPNNKDNYCAAGHSQDNFAWRDEHCNNTLNFVCQIDMTTTQAPTTAATTTEMQTTVAPSTQQTTTVVVTTEPTTNAPTTTETPTTTKLATTTLEPSTTLETTTGEESTTVTEATTIIVRSTTLETTTIQPSTVIVESTSETESTVQSTTVVPTSSASSTAAGSTELSTEPTTTVSQTSTELLTSTDIPTTVDATTNNITTNIPTTPSTTTTTKATTTTTTSKPPARTTTTTTTTTTVAPTTELTTVEPWNVTTNLTGPDGGGSTGGTTSNVFLIVLLTIIAILVVSILIAIGAFIVYKKTHTVAKVRPGNVYDARPQASVAQSDPLGENVSHILNLDFTPAGSTAALMADPSIFESSKDSAIPKKNTRASNLNQTDRTTQNIITIDNSDDVDC